MINHNLILFDVLDRKITVNYQGADWVVNYAEGDLFELANVLLDRERARETKYPYIWLQSGYVVERDRIKGTVKLSGCKIFFITSSDLQTRYRDRFAGNYGQFLYKIIAEFDKLIMKTNGMEANLRDEFRIFPLNNTDEFVLTATENKIAIQDIWDAVELSTDIEITEECFPQFKI